MRNIFKRNFLTDRVSQFPVMALITLIVSFILSTGCSILPTTNPSTTKRPPHCGFILGILLTSKPSPPFRLHSGKRRDSLIARYSLRCSRSSATSKTPGISLTFWLDPST